MSTILITLDLVIKLVFLVWVLYKLIKGRTDSNLPLLLLFTYLLVKEILLSLLRNCTFIN